jgi:2-dehydro-3-deoxy-D-arabinonate dehydratase
MKIYKSKNTIIIENENSFYSLENQDWDQFINDDELYSKLTSTIAGLKPDSRAADLVKTEIDAPIKSQEIWASGVTYYRSKVGRQEESKNSGGGEFYARVYEAERPELFFKATASRTVGHGGKVVIRKDSTWDVPEPELTLFITSSGKIVGYTVGNDMSSRSIEGENPLYLPQAKTYDGSAAIGPCIYVSDKPLPSETTISIEIIRKAQKVFEGTIQINQIKRTFDELASFLFRECSFPHGCFLMTGTGIVPGNEFTLIKDDEIRITIDYIGTLVNTVR